jgi:OOP family OmpA-OmpF porin
MEDMLLASEEPLRRIAAELGFRAEFDEGPNEATEKTLQRISEYEAAVEDLQSQLAGRTEQIAGLEARISELEADLGGVQLERSELAEAIAAQAQLREKFTRVEQMFDRDEARVLREGNDVIVRLTGLTFAVGKSDIEPAYFALLTSVQYAIAEFPGARVSIEGHTDSFGGDEQNQQLSQDRADAVREYLVANMRLDPARIDAIGYGETRPVASNETPEGRAKNRRIEVVIHAELTSVN